jgi:hypothetical protein
MAEEKTLAEVCRLNEEEQKEWIAAASVERRIELFKEAMQLSLAGELLEGGPLWALFEEAKPAMPHGRLPWLMGRFSELLGCAITDEPHRPAGGKKPADGSSPGKRDVVKMGGKSLAEASGDAESRAAQVRSFDLRTERLRKFDERNRRRALYDSSFSAAGTAGQAPDMLHLEQQEREEAVISGARLATYVKEVLRQFNKAKQAPSLTSYRVLGFRFAQAEDMFFIPRDSATYRIIDTEVERRIAQAASMGAVDKSEEEGSFGPFRVSAESARAVILLNSEQKKTAKTTGAEEEIYAGYDEIGEILSDTKTGFLRSQAEMFKDFLRRLGRGCTTPKHAMNQALAIIKAALTALVKVGNDAGVCEVRKTRNLAQLAALFQELEAMARDESYAHGIAPKDLAVSNAYVLVAQANLFLYTTIKQEPQPIYLTGEQRARMVAAWRRSAPTAMEVAKTVTFSEPLPPVSSPAKPAAGRQVPPLLGRPRERVKKRTDAARKYASWAAYAAAWVNDEGTFRDQRVCSEEEYQILDELYLSYYDFERPSPKDLKVSSARNLVQKFKAYLATSAPSGSM